jgi:hypothetical protein
MTPVHMQPFFSALQDLMLDGDPKPTRRQFSCNACLDSGELSEGGPCNWCAVGDPPEPDDADDDLTVEQMCLNMGVK